MSEIKFEKKEKPEELIRAEKLIDVSKLDEALKLLNNYEQKEGFNHYDKASCLLLKCKILFWQGKSKELNKLVEQTDNKSGGWDNNLFKTEGLLRAANLLSDLYKLDEAFDLINKGEELIKTFPQELTKAYKQMKAYLIFTKGHFYRRRRSPNDIDLSLEYLEHSVALREELGIKHEIAESLDEIAMNLCYSKGEMNRALKYAERSLALAKESSKKYYIAVSLHVMALIYSFQGEIDRSIRFYEQCITHCKEINNKPYMASSLNNLSNNYKMRGGLDRALECIEQSIALNREMGDIEGLANNHDFLIQILMDKGNYERAQISLNDLERLNNKLKIKGINSTYLFDKALVLKTSLRAIKRGKAEEILKQLLEEEDLSYEGRVNALVSLCELLLTELRMTNDLEVLNEVNQFIGQLLENVEKSHSYPILCETYLIQAKLSLLTFNIKRAQRYLTQAHQIAERFDFTQLTGKIANEKEELLKRLDLWKKLKEDDAPMADRMELARLDEKTMKAIQNHLVFTVQVSEEKVAIHKEKKICLVCRGEVLRFTYICECGANYCDNCARALTDLENVCWVCDVPLDYLKPIKPYKEETKEIQIDKKHKKS
ncbi:MAG: tetratricopeptide repeat protein [Candidatus Lokiarchaeota archaeon]|nr:tetratricopeptide repeat protein [Candidatus Lokiarchaeota archaeon]